MSVEITSQKEAFDEIRRILDEISSLYAECERIGVEHDVAFHYSGPAGYGDGGYFDPHGQDWAGNDEMWQASSAGC